MGKKIEGWLPLVVRLILAAVFIYAAVQKIIDPVTFSKEIDNYQMLPYILVSLMAVILPWLELFCGVLFIMGKGLRGASLILIAMNIVFIIAIGSAMARGLDISCGCFGAGASEKVGFRKIGEDVLFLAGATFVYYRTLMAEKISHPKMV
jgi:putative oxidoreductase